MVQNRHPFGSHFRFWRERRGLSLKEAAGDIISIQHLSQFELGKKNISITTLSRLLVSIGVDWIDFMTNYRGERVDYAFTLLDSKPQSSHITRLKQELDGYYDDNPILKEMFLVSQLGIDNSSEVEGATLPSNAQHLIDSVSEQKFLNAIENDVYAIYQNYFPLSFVLAYKDMKLERLTEDMEMRDLTSIHNDILALATTVVYLSNNGYYIECQKLIDVLRERYKQSSYMFFSDFLIAQVLLEAQQVYLYLRQDKPEAFPKAREVIEIFEQIYKFTGDSYIVKRKTDFLRTFNLLNTSGKLLYED